MNQRRGTDLRHPRRSEHRLLSVSAVIILGCAPGASMARPAARGPARSGAFTVEMQHDLRTVSHALMAPDGRSVVYVVSTPPKKDEARGRHRGVIWLAGLGAQGTGAAPPRPLTASAFDSTGPLWAPDSRKIAFLSTRKGLHAEQQVYVMAVDGGEPWQLTTADKGVKAYAWSADGKRIAYTAPEPPSEEQKKAGEEGRDWNVAGIHREHHRLWLMDLDTREAREVVDDLHVVAVTWSPASDRLLFRAANTPDVDAEYMRTQLYTMAAKPGAAAGKARQLTGHEGKLEAMAWSPDGRHVAYVGGLDMQDPTGGVIFVADASGKSRALTADFPGTVTWVDWRDSQTVVFAAIRGPETVMATIDIRSRRIRGFGGGAQQCYELGLARDRRRYACAGSEPDRPGEVYVGLVGEGAPRRVTTTNPAVENVRFAPQEIVVWNASDGLKVQGIFLRPPAGKKGGRPPLVVLPHGGPEGSFENGFLSRYHYPAQLLAARGYAVLLPNYRGSGGRGVAYGKADQKDLGGREFDDILAGIDHLAQKGMINPQRVGIAGWSYGGYLSAWAATRHSSRFKAAVVGAGIANWLSFQGTTDIPDEFGLVHWALEPYRELALVRDRSPITHIDSAKTATLILHGEKDLRVPASQAWELHRGLRAVGVTTELVIYPREPHGLEEIAHQADALARILAWFDRHL